MNVLSGPAAPPAAPLRGARACRAAALPVGVSFRHSSPMPTRRRIRRAASTIALVALWLGLAPIAPVGPAAAACSPEAGGRTEADGPDVCSSAPRHLARAAWSQGIVVKRSGSQTRLEGPAGWTPDAARVWLPSGSVAVCLIVRESTPRGCSPVLRGLVVSGKTDLPPPIV